MAKNVGGRRANKSRGARAATGRRRSQITPAPPSTPGSDTPPSSATVAVTARLSAKSLAAQLAKNPHIRLVNTADFAGIIIGGFPPKRCRRH
jgi:hypothetical protein